MISQKTLRLVKRGLSDYDESEINQIAVKQNCSFYQAAELFFKGNLKGYM